MKIGLDFHGVINTSPEFFSVISNLLVKNGHEVHIITGNDANEKLIQDLDNFGISYTHIFSIVEYHRKNGTKITYEWNGPWMDKEIWNRTKADYCERKKIDIMIDDSIKYGELFKTPFINWKKIV